MLDAKKLGNGRLDNSHRCWRYSVQRSDKRGGGWSKCERLIYSSPLVHDINMISGLRTQSLKRLYRRRNYRILTPLNSKFGKHRPTPSMVNRSLLECQQRKFFFSGVGSQRATARTLQFELGVFLTTTANLDWSIGYHKSFKSKLTKECV